MIKVFCDRCGKEIKNKTTFMPIYAYDGKGNKIMLYGNKCICEDCAKKFDEIKDVLLKKHYEQDFLQMTDADIDLLRNTFKVGDKVITADGLKGVITHVCTCARCKERGFYEPKVEFNDGDTDYITVSDKDNGFKSYYSIGDHVFGNLDEESVIRELNDISCRRAQLEEQLGTLLVLKREKEKSR